jgi:hypothetical protein
LWLTEAERTYLIAQALPNRSADVIEEMASDELDSILMVQGVYKAVYGQDPYRHTHE